MDSHIEHDAKTELAIKETVKKHGWYIAMFEATDYLPSFAYTIGLLKNYNHPELIMFGLTTQNMAKVLNIAGDYIKGGSRLELNQNTNIFFENVNSHIIKVHQDNLSDYFGYALWFNEKLFPAYQIVWADRHKKFPWEEGFEQEFRYKQPLLDRNTEFKFFEAKNLGVFTNLSNIQSEKPVVYIAHDYNGDWQFLTDDKILEDEKPKLVCLEELVKKDLSLNQAFDLDYGEYAERKSINDPWTRGQLDSEEN